MIVVDTSAIIAIMKAEPEASAFITLLGTATRSVMAAPTRFETLMVAISRKDDQARLEADGLIEKLGIEIVDWTAQFADLATDAFDKYGKGRHKAALNFGDCMAYALAKSLNAPLLYKGNDFALTDLRSAA